MSRKTSPKDVQRSIYRAMRSIPLVGELFQEEQDELVRRSKQLEYEKGQYKNALTASMRALNQTKNALEEMVKELEIARQEIRRLLAPQEPDIDASAATAKPEG